MQAATTYEGALSPSDYPDLVELLRQRGRVVTCYMNTDVAHEDAVRRCEIRWKDLSRELTDQGANTADIEAARAAFESVRRQGPAVCAVVSGGEVLLAEVGPGEVAKDHGYAGPLPALGTLLTWRQHDVAYITVACDHAGADIAVLSPGEAFTATAGDADRHDPELHKFGGGGWSHRRYQERVENTWERNAKAVTSVLERLVKAVSPRLVIYGGDPRSCAFLEGEAGPVLGPLMQRVELSRAADGSDSLHAVHRAVETAVAADTAHLLAQAKELRSKSMVASGPDEVLDALTDCRAEVLLLHDDLADGRRAYLSRSPLLASLDRRAIEGVAADADIAEARLVDVAVAAAFLSGASLRMVPAAVVEGGMSAMLRFG